MIKLYFDIGLLRTHHITLFIVNSPKNYTDLVIRFFLFGKPQKIFNVEYFIGVYESIPGWKGIPWVVPTHEVTEISKKGKIF